MNELMLFDNDEFGEIRGIEIEGKPYVVANDVLKALGYAEGSWSTTLKRKCKGVTNCKGLEYRGNLLNLIPEGDIYRLIFSSKLPSAQKFEEWVMDEVLPQIRQTGGYIPVNQEDDDETILAKALVIAQKTLEKKDKLIKEMQPKVNWFENFLNSEGTYNSTQVAKLFKLSSAQKLNKLLNENKIIYKQGKNWYTYSNVDKSWYKLIVGNSNEHNYSQLKFTPKGVYEISKLLQIEFDEEDLEQIS